MWFYIILFMLVVGITILSKNKQSNKISMILLWSVYAFRNQLAVDDEGYILAFQRINKGWNYYIEPTFKFFAKLAYGVGMNYKFIFLIYATIAFIFLYLATELLFDNNYQKGLFLATFLGYSFIATISVMRQFTAAAICLYAMIYLYKTKKTVRTTIMCIIATVFHTSSAITFPLILIFEKKWKISYKQKIITILLCIVVGYSNLATFLLIKFINWLPMSYQVYRDSISGQFSSAGGMVSMIFLLMFLLQCYISYKNKRIEPKNEMIDILEKGQLIYLGVLFLLVNAGVASRVAFTFIIFVATIPYTFFQRIDRKNRIILNILFIILMFVLYVLTIKTTSNLGTNMLIPYNGSFNFINK